MMSRVNGIVIATLVLCAPWLGVVAWCLYRADVRGLLRDAGSLPSTAERVRERLMPR
jgi:hypothetical protein